MTLTMRPRSHIYCTRDGQTGSERGRMSSSARSNLIEHDVLFARSPVAYHICATGIGASSYYEMVLRIFMSVSTHRVAADIIAGARFAMAHNPNELVPAQLPFEFERPGDALDRAFGGNWILNVLNCTSMCTAHCVTGTAFDVVHHALCEGVLTCESAEPMLSEKVSCYLRCEPSEVSVLNGAEEVSGVRDGRWEYLYMVVREPPYAQYPYGFPEVIRYLYDVGKDWYKPDRHSGSNKALVS